MSRGRSNNGAGSIVRHKGRDKEYQVQITVDGRRKSGGYFKTHSEAVTTMRDLVSQIDKNEYVEPQKMLLSEWLRVWVTEYCRNIKASTVVAYKGYINNHINPVLGQIRLCNLQPHMIQRFVNHLEHHGKNKSKPLSSKTRKNIHGCLSAALEKAVRIRYLKENPATGCSIPRDDDETRSQIINPLNTAQIIQFTKEIKGTNYERIYIIALYTGMRLSEILGLQWDRVNLETGELLISKQLAMLREKGDKRRLVAPKSRRVRSIIVPKAAIDQLHAQMKAQCQSRLIAGQDWNNEMNLVFTNSFYC